MANTTIRKSDGTNLVPVKAVDNGDGTYSEGIGFDPIDVSQTITIAQGQSVSAAIDTGSKAIIGFKSPAALEATTAQLSFQASETLAGTYVPVYKNGVKVTLTIAVDAWDRLSELTDLYHVRFLKIVAETAAGVAVAQAGDARVFTVIKS